MSLKQTLTNRVTEDGAIQGDGGDELLDDGAPNDGTGHDFLDGDDGNDTTVFDGNFSDFDVTKLEADEATVVGENGAAHNFNFENLQFDNDVFGTNIFDAPVEGVARESASQIPVSEPVDTRQIFQGTEGDGDIDASSDDDIVRGDGGEGNGAAVFEGEFDDITVVNLANGELEITNADGSSAVTNIEYLQFNDLAPNNNDLLNRTEAKDNS